MTLDEDYQRKRQQAINRRPQNFSEGMARGAKGVGQGFYEGITGVVSKPLEGTVELVLFIVRFDSFTCAVARLAEAVLSFHYSWRGNYSSKINRLKAAGK